MVNSVDTSKMGMDVRYAKALVKDWEKYQYPGRIKTNLHKQAEIFLKNNYQNTTHYAENRVEILQKTKLRTFDKRQSSILLLIMV